ncbi:hypothetical protein [Sutcliffiella horikoshii]|uniref:hypothetical protein n=1 Tax=Sutcliffiella horikoshii TaxID=79883 RepID=UPI0016537633|nr:hypothetical protein [Sutcliffiella horikoshii]
MRIADRLPDDQRQKLQGMNKKKRKRKPEKVDWHDIMGMNRDTFKRSKGAIRRR